MIDFDCEDGLGVRRLYARNRFTRLEASMRSGARQSLLWGYPLQGVSVDILSLGQMVSFQTAS